MKLRLNSEFGTLKAVLMHRPGKEIDRLTICASFCLKICRRVISYNRNCHTNRALRDAGVEVLPIPSSELSRGLGGPRCMTMALDRQDFHWTPGASGRY
jgi:arginine deiminase